MMYRFVMIKRSIVSKTVLVGVLGGVASGIAGCASIDVNIPGPLIESPEIESKAGTGGLGFGTDDSTRYVYTTDASARPPVLSNPEIQKAQYFFTRAGYTFTDWLEFGVRLAPGDLKNFFVGGIGATARLQLIGAGSEGGFKFAIYGGALQSSASASGDQRGVFGPGGYNWKASASSQTLTAGSSIGYRFAGASVLIYLAGAYADQTVSGSISQDLSTDGTSPATSYPLTQVKGNTRTAALGIRIGKDAQFGIEARGIMRSWPGLSAPETRGGGESTLSSYTFSLYYPL